MRRVGRTCFWIILIALPLVTTLSCRDTTTSRKDLQIGAIMALTGDVASYGVRVKDGVDLAVERINADGGVRGRKLQILYEDNQGDPTEAVSAFEKLAQVDKVPLVIGPMLSTESLATAPVAERAKVVQLSTLPGTIKLRDAGDFVFRLFPSDEFQGKYLADKAIDTFGSRRAAIIYLDNAYGRGIRDVVSARYEERGGMIVTQEAVAEGEVNFTSHVTLLRRAEPDLVFGLMYYNEGAQFLVQADQQGLEVPVLGGDAWFGPIAEIAGPSLRLLTFSSVAFGPAFATDAPMSEFITLFRDKYGRTPDSYNATGYDAVIAVSKAIEAAESTAAADIRDALYQLEFRGALGTVKFDQNGDNVGASFSLFRLLGEEAVPLDDLTLK